MDPTPRAIVVVIRREEVKDVGEIDKAVARMVAQKVEDLGRREVTVEALNEKLRAVQDRESALADEMYTHADACAVCADTYVREKRLAYRQCTTADSLGVRADAILKDRMSVLNELAYPQD